jgi:hypothetical protein
VTEKPTEREFRRAEYLYALLAAGSVLLAMTAMFILLTRPTC